MQREAGTPSSPDQAALPAAAAGDLVFGVNNPDWPSEDAHGARVPGLAVATGTASHSSATEAYACSCRHLNKSSSAEADAVFRGTISNKSRWGAANARIDIRFTVDRCTGTVYREQLWPPS